jgi:hypothetical protein
MPEMSELLWNEKHGCVCARSREVHRYRQNRSGCGGARPTPPSVLDYLPQCQAWD